MFSDVRRRPSSLSLSASLPVVKATGDQTKLARTLNEMTNFSGFDHCWKCLGSSTQLNKIQNKGLVVFFKTF